MTNILRMNLKKQSHPQWNHLPKYCGIKLTKEVKDFSNENLMKLGKTVENGETSYGHRSVGFIL